MDYNVYGMVSLRPYSTNLINNTKTLIMNTDNKKTETEQCTIPSVIPRFSPETKNSTRLKSLFQIYFDGCYSVDAEPNTHSTFEMGVCKLEYKDNELIVHLRRPGLLIGKGGCTIDALSKQLDCKIGIVEVNPFSNEV